MKKKLLSFLLALVMIVSIIPCPKASAAAAETTAALTVEGLWANPGDTVDVKVSIAGNPGILGAILTVSWDQTLTLVGDTSGEVFSYMTYTSPSRYNPAGTNFVWFGNEVGKVMDGVVLNLTFQVSETTKNNEVLPIKVTYTPGDIFDGNDRDVILSITNGYVHVIDYTPGDVTNDGRVNTRDLVCLSQYISDGCKTDPEGYNAKVVEGACDVNGDGRINARDLIRLSQYISDGNQTNPEGYNAVLQPAKLPDCEHADMTATEAKAATCTENGNIAYWYCPSCQKYFSDEGEVTLSETVVEALGHHVVLVPGYDATKTEPGLTDGMACDRVGCDYVEVPQEEIPVITGFKIDYEIANGEDYIEKQNLILPADKMQYFTEEGLELPQLKVAGYRFIGWSYSQASSANIITEIPKGATGDKTLYAHWTPIVYTVTFDTPDVQVNGTKVSGETILNATEYTVDKGKDLPVPKCFGYTFVGWSNDDGFIVTRIKPGTTGHMTLHANWTSDRNKATSYQSYGEPIIIEDDKNGQLLFVYNIGRIDNVPLNEVEFIGKTETLNFKKEVSITDTVDEKLVKNINSMVSEATTKSSGWTLSKEWNDIYSTAEEVGSLSEKSDERTTTDGKTVGGKYFVSNSEGGSSHVSTESGGSISNSSKVTTENSMGINASYDTSTEKYCDAKLSASNTTEVSAGVEVPVKVAKVSAGVKNTTTVGAEVQNGRKDTSSFHIDGSISSYVGTVNNTDTSAHYNSYVSNDSSWNTTTGYEQSSEVFKEESVTSALKEQISKTTTHNLSKALGEQNTTTEAKEEQLMSSEEYSTGFTYNKGTQETVKKVMEFNSSEPGYYRIITAGTVHVYAIVGYDIATASYYTSCYNVLDDTTREILDYSKENMNFNDCENGVVTFDVPYEVNEYVAGFVGKTDGLEISYEGTVTGFTPSETFEGTVVVPQYEAKNNKDGSFSAVQVSSFDAGAFAGKESIHTVVLPLYITEIPAGAFAGCTNLKTVIAYGVTKIGANAFKDCTNLEKFYVDNAITELGEKAFENVPQVAITAYDSKVADAAIGCGAKEISLNIGYIKDTYENKVVKIGSDVAYFALIGNGGSYKNVQIESDANETMISNMIFAENQDNPIKLGSQKVTLARVTVENSPAFALVLTADQVELDLLGTVSLNAAVENTVLSKNVILDMADRSTTSSLVVNGKYLVCGEVTNQNYLNVKPTVITQNEFESYLVSSIVTFNVNGGSVAQESKIVYMGQTYGTLPTPVREYFAFTGWYTQADGGELVTADTDVTTKVNHTLYAHWEAITATLVFDANGGQVSQGNKLVYLGKTVGSLPVPTRTDCTFLGWYKADGTKVTDSTVLAEPGNITVKAYWETNWVKASALPSGTSATATKWTYDLTTRTTSNSATAPAGFSVYKDPTWVWGEYGAWSSWSKTAATASDSRKIETKTVTDQAAYTNYKYYIYRTSDGWGFGTKNYYTGSSHGSCTKYDEINLSYALPLHDASLGLYGPYNSSMFSHSGDSYWFFSGSNYVAAVTHTEYRYADRSKIYTYYYQKIEAKETTTEISASDTVSNVQKWVKYVID